VITQLQLINIIITKEGEGKAVPLQARCGPQGSRRLRHPDFLTIGTLRW